MGGSPVASWRCGSARANSRLAVAVRGFGAFVVLASRTLHGSGGTIPVVPSHSDRVRAGTDFQAYVVYGAPMEKAAWHDNELAALVDFLRERGIDADQAEEVVLSSFALGADSGLGTGFWRGFLAAVGAMVLAVVVATTVVHCLAG